MGEHTRGIPPPPDRAGVLEDTVGFMVGNGYIEIVEVPGIPVLEKTPDYMAYGPVEASPFPPGRQWDAVVAGLESISQANSAMEAYYRRHQSQFPILS